MYIDVSIELNWYCVDGVLEGLNESIELKSDGRGGSGGGQNVCFWGIGGSADGEMCVFGCFEMHFWSFYTAVGAKIVSGHRYFLQYPPNSILKSEVQKLANNVLFRYPPPPPPPPLKPPFWPPLRAKFTSYRAKILLYRAKYTSTELNYTSTELNYTSTELNYTSIPSKRSYPSQYPITLNDTLRFFLKAFLH